MRKSTLLLLAVIICVYAPATALGKSVAGPAPKNFANGHPLSLPLFGDRRHQKAVGCSVDSRGTVTVSGGFGARKAYPADLIATGRVTSRGKLRRNSRGKFWRNQLRVDRRGIAAILNDQSVLLSRFNRALNKTEVRRILVNGEHDRKFGSRGVLRVEGVQKAAATDSGGFTMKSGQGASTRLGVYRASGAKVGADLVVPGDVQSLTRDSSSGFVHVAVSGADGTKSILRYDRSGAPVASFERNGISGSSNFDQTSSVRQLAYRDARLFALVESQETLGDPYSNRISRIVQLSAGGAFVRESQALLADPHPGDSGEPSTFQRSLWITSGGEAVLFNWKRRGLAEGKLDIQRWNPQLGVVVARVLEGPTNVIAPARGRYFDSTQAVPSADGRTVTLCGSINVNRRGLEVSTRVAIKRVKV